MTKYKSGFALFFDPQNDYNFDRVFSDVGLIPIASYEFQTEEGISINIGGVYRSKKESDCFVIVKKELGEPPTLDVVKVGVFSSRLFRADSIKKQLLERLVEHRTSIEMPSELQDTSGLELTAEARN